MKFKVTLITPITPLEIKVDAETAKEAEEKARATFPDAHVTEAYVDEV